MNTQFTIITVCYNAIDIIEKTILSVINQTYTNIEYIIIDGGSTDGTVEIIKKYSDQLAFWCSEKDKGIFDAMNKGVSKSKNKNGFVNFLNAGDCLYSKNTIQNVAQKINPNSLFISGIAKYPNGRYWFPISENRIKINNIYKGGSVNHQSSFISIKLLRDDNYDIRYKITSDDLYFIKKVGLEKVNYQKINLIIALYDNTGISNDKNRKHYMLEERKNFLKEQNIYITKDLNKTHKERFLEIFRKLFLWIYTYFYFEKLSR